MIECHNYEREKKMKIENEILGVDAFERIGNPEFLLLKGCGDLLETSFYFRRLSKLRVLTIDGGTYDEGTCRAMGAHLKSLVCFEHLVIRGKFIWTVGCIALFHNLERVHKLSLVSMPRRVRLPKVKELNYYGTTVLPPGDYVQTGIEKAHVPTTVIPGLDVSPMVWFEGLYHPKIHIGRTTQHLVLRKVDASDLRLARNLSIAGIPSLSLHFKRCDKESLIRFIRKMGSCTYIPDPESKIHFDISQGPDGGEGGGGGGDDDIEFEDESDKEVHDLINYQFRDRPRQLYRLIHLVGMDTTKKMITCGYI
mgnify:CR=1 FL=1